ncbi:MAG: DUF3558 domain-containing protein [Nocardia sp.]|nr:DUF3558 domain-containing protein [Nocardia sp.]
MNSSEPTSTKPIVAVSVKPTEEQDPDGRKPVTFDPCVSIGDSVVQQAGFDPKTRERKDDPHTGYAFVGCTFSRRKDAFGVSTPINDLTISSTDITLDQFRQRQNGNLQEITINGIKSITYQGYDATSCYVVMPGPDGSIDLSISSFAGMTDWMACDHRIEIASTIQTALPKK